MAEERKPFRLNPAYIAMSKALLMQAGEAYATINPLVGLGVAAAQTIFATQAAIARQNDILARAQIEEWTEDDARWNEHLAYQQQRMDAEDARHAELIRERAAPTDV